MTPSSIRVEIGGTNIHDLSPDCILVEMRAEHAANQHSSCFLEYRQTPDLPFDMTKFFGIFVNVLAEVESGSFSIFQGTVESAIQRYDARGTHHLLITANGLSIDLDQQNRFHTFTNGITYSAKLKEVLADHSLMESQFVMQGEDPPVRSYQLGESDWQHLLADTSDAGAMLITDGDKLLATDHFTSSGLTLNWRAEGGLISFEIESQFQASMRRGVNYDREAFKSKIFEKIVDDVPRLGAVAAICDHAKSMNQVELVQGADSQVTMEDEQLAEAALKAASRAALAQSVKARGESRESQLLVGRSIEIAGSPQFSGKWGITKLTHRWQNAGYLNEFECTPFDTAQAAEMPSLPPATGHYRARVVSAPNRDTGRIQIQFPWEPDDSRSLFWPWLTPHAGADRGICFPPEVGDEVLVAFHNGDQANPYIVSAAWNGKELPPLEDLHGNEFKDNDIKRIVTKSGNRLVMDDKEGKETMVMATPRHVRVSLFDGGQTLLLHSDGDVHIHAGGTVHMKCKQFLREVG